jgi:MmyB-like transcription regulator ligand binding domain
VVQQMLDCMTDAPAFVLNERLDVLAVNELGRALYAPMFAGAPERVNHARFTFLDPASHDFWVNWDKAAKDTASILRAAAGRDQEQTGVPASPV